MREKLLAGKGLLWYTLCHVGSKKTHTNKKREHKNKEQDQTKQKIALFLGGDFKFQLFFDPHPLQLTCHIFPPGKIRRSWEPQKGGKRFGVSKIHPCSCVCFSGGQQKKPGCLGYTRNYTTQLCGDYNKPF